MDYLLSFGYKLIIAIFVVDLLWENDQIYNLISGEIK